MRYFFAIYIAVMPAALVAQDAAFHIYWPVESGVGREYWERHSLLYGSVERLAKHRIDEREQNVVTFRPFGKVSGKFDAGLFVRVQVDTQELTPLPDVGDRALLVVVSRPQQLGKWDEDHKAMIVKLGGSLDDFSIGYPASYMLGQNDPLRVVKGFSDPDVLETTKSVARLRRHDIKDKTLPDSAPNWSAIYPHSFIIGEITKISEALATDGKQSKITIQPSVGVAAASKGSDATPIEVSITLWKFRSRFKLPAVGAKVLVDTIAIDGLQGQNYVVLPEPAEYMPDDHSPIYEVKGSDDPCVTQAVFWRTHSLIYAEVYETRSSKDNKSPGTIVLRPRLTLSGEIDPAKTPEITAPTDTKILESRFHILFSGGAALFVLTRTADGYSVTADPTPFMPGDHSPICPVKDFDDPQVQESLMAVQKLRHAKAESKLYNEPTKQ